MTNVIKAYINFDPVSGVFLLKTMYQNIVSYLSQCPHCQVANNWYTVPHRHRGSLIANNPMNLLCMDFIKIDPSGDGPTPK